MRRVAQALSVVALACGLCLVWSYSAKAADPQNAAKPIDPGALFDTLDTNHTGVLSADKIPEDKRGLFERLLRLAGKPADGQLTRAEFVAQLKSITEPPNSGAATSGSATAKSEPAPAAGLGRKAPNPEKAFDRLDKNHTGKLTLSDIPEERQKFFKRLLKEAGKPEGDSLTKEEFVKAFEAVLAKRAGTEGTKATGAAKNKPSATAGQIFDIDRVVERLMKLSTRPDGKLTKSDLPERLQARFDKIDANKDGLIDKAELRAWLTNVKRQLAAVRALNGSPTEPAKPESAKPDASK